MSNETHLAHLGITKEEHQLILKLQTAVKDQLTEKILAYSNDDLCLYLVRWIRARENNLDKATELLQSHLNWRQKVDADQILDKKLHPFFRENFPFHCAGVDTKGQPAMCIDFSEWDFRKVVNNPDRLEEFEDFLTHFFETCMHHIGEERQKQTGAEKLPITQMTVLFDAKSFALGQLLSYGAVKKIMQAASVYEAHYPECVCDIMFINCPSYFGMLINIIKPVLAPKTMAKIKCYPSMTKWQEEMSDFVDPAILPARYGGTQE